MFDFDWKIYTAFAFVLLLMALPILHRKFYGKVPEINVNDLLQASKNYRLIDLRLENEFRLSHIKHAVNIPCIKFEQCKQQVIELLSSGDQSLSTIIICDTDLVSTKLAKKLNDEGCKNIFILKGGLNFWKRKQLPLVSDSSAI